MERCGHCYFFHKLKEVNSDGIITKACCTLFPQTEPNDGYESFAMVVDEMDRCECFTDRNEVK